LSQDLYKRFLDPGATDARLLRIVRWTTVASGIVSVVLSLASEDVIATLTVFYTLLGVALFVPVLAGLYLRRAGSRRPMGWILAGVAATAIVHLTTGGAGVGLVTPALAGLAAAVAAWMVSLVFDVT